MGNTCRVTVRFEMLCFAVRRLVGIGILALVALGHALLISVGAHAEPAAGMNGPLKVGVFVSSDGNRCFAPGLVAAIRYFTSQYVARVNAAGGIGGRTLELAYFDDYEDAGTAITNVKTAIDDPAMMAMIGVPSSTRGEAIFNALGPQLRERAIPFITEISLDSLFRDDQNVFTMASSVRNELEAVAKVITDGGYQRPVFVGLDDDLYSIALGQGLAALPSGPALAANVKAPVRDYKLDEADAQKIASDVAAQNPDLVLIAIHSGPSAALLRKLAEAGVKAPVFVLLGRIQNIVNVLGAGGFAGPMSQIAREGVPNVYSERLRQRIWHAPQDTWVFDDVRNDDAPGWKDGSCDDRGEAPARQLFDAANKRAVGRGTQYRDMLQLIVDGARSTAKSDDVPELRRHIGTQLRGFVEGRQVLKGLWQDWAFTSERTAAEDTLILQKGAGDDAIVLAPIQYRRVNGTLQRSPTVYTSIDLISLSRIDSNDRSFDAQFYLSMRSADDRIDINKIEFTNAYRSQSGEGRLLITREIADGGTTSEFPAGVKIYKVSGKFEFEPDLGDYPFDTQRLSVSFQPANAAEPFLIQPTQSASAAEQQSDAAVDGWELKERYVGSDQDIVPTLGNSLDERRIVPFYKFNATWVVKRLAVDYYLRVVVPLAFILLVTYFSVFLPHSRFESIMAIEVTALLSAIALYLALPKVDSDQATFSDKLFMLTYAAVTVMIGLSILKDNMRKTKAVAYVVSFLQWFVFPVATLAFIIHLLPGTKLDTPELAHGLAALWHSIAG